MSDAQSKQQKLAFEQCPDCYGRGFHEIEAVCMGCDGMDETHTHPDRRETCATCHGAGVLSGLALAIRKARGDPPPPPPMRGFA